MAAARDPSSSRRRTGGNRRANKPGTTPEPAEPPPPPRNDVPSAPRRAWLKQRWQLLGEWQGAALPYPGRKVKPVNEVIDQILRELDLDERLCADAVVAEWQQLVGSFIASHSRPEGLKRGVLTVRVVQPTVRYALEGEKPGILRRLQERFGSRKIRQLRFQIG